MKSKSLRGKTTLDLFVLPQAPSTFTGFLGFRLFTFSFPKSHWALTMSPLVSCTAPTASKSTDFRAHHHHVFILHSDKLPHLPQGPPTRHRWHYPESEIAVRKSDHPEAPLLFPQDFPKVILKKAPIQLMKNTLADLANLYWLISSLQ